MRQFSDDEEGFISSEFQIKLRKATRQINQNIKIEQNSNNARVNYRFSDGFIKKQPSLVFNTPLTLHTEPLTARPRDNRQNSRSDYHHPYKEYSVGEQYSLRYCRQSSQPLLNEKQFIKNQVQLSNIEDKNSPSLKELKCFEIQQNPSGDDLSFDSKFQSGNLHCAFRKNKTNQYHLFLSNDTNTLGYNQWFYFSVFNLKKAIKYVFKIVNYKKMLNFYKNGMRIAIFSMKQAQKNKTGWYYGGNNINFQQSKIKISEIKRLYTLIFQFQALHSNDYIMFASNVPYSYSRLLKDLKQIENDSKPIEDISITVQSACLSLCNNEVPQVTITGKNTQKKDKDKRLIIFMARQHPGEIFSSYMALGVMRSFLKETPQIKYLLQNYLVKIYPMINVDGVIYGNFRCDATGVDLNRRWKQPSKIFHPQVFEIKRRIQNYSKKWRIDICFDLHGHSKKYNIFCYSCKNNSYTCRILPQLINNTNSLFSIPSCTFGLTRDKQTTARGAISKIIRSQNVLTIQTSGFGQRMNIEARLFHPLDIFRMAESILVASRYFVDKKSSKFQQSQKRVRLNYDQYLAYDHQNQQESGSQSEPQEDEIDFRVKLATVIDKIYSGEETSFCNNNHAAKLSVSDVPFNGPEFKNIKHPQKQKKSEKNKKQKIIESHNTKQLKKQQTLVVQTQKYQEIDMEQSTNKRLKKPFHKEKEDYEKKSMSIGHSQIGIQSLEITTDKKTIQKLDKKFKIRDNKDKKRLSFIQDFKDKDTLTIDFQQGQRAKEFKEFRKERDKRSIEDFVSKFQKFIPGYKGARLDLLQEGLDHDNPQTQLNVMLQNKQKLQLQRLRQRIQERTQLTQRQGKIKTHKKEPIIDFKRFKLNQKMMQQTRLGQLSQRYFQGQL